MFFFAIKSSSDNVIFSLEASVKDIQFVVSEIYEFEYWGIAKILKLLEVLDNHESDAIFEMNNFSIGSASRSAKLSI